LRSWRSGRWSRSRAASRSTTSRTMPPPGLTSSRSAPSPTPLRSSTSLSTSSRRSRPTPVMLLAIDAGNTQTVLGLFRGEELLEPWRIATNAERTSDEHGLLIGQFLAHDGMSFDDVTGLVVSSTVPRLTAVLRDMAERYFAAPLVVVEPGTRTGMPILYENP